MHLVALRKGHFVLGEMRRSYVGNFRMFLLSGDDYHGCM